MNAHTTITPAVDIDLTAIMEAEGIVKIERFGPRYSVLLFDGRLGIDATIGGALAKAKLPGAMNVRRAA